MTRWQRTTKQHALGHRYDYFVQCSRKRTWRSEVANETRELRKHFGAFEEWKEHHWVCPKHRLWFQHPKERIVNPDWFLDAARKRLWITERARVVLELWK